jgi:hypothetical protein
VRLVFVDGGSYHHEDVPVPVEVLGQYERIIDCLQEDPVLLKRLHVDLERLCAAYVVDR